MSDMDDDFMCDEDDDYDLVRNLIDLKCQGLCVYCFTIIALYLLMWFSPR